jgi:hypothetical protein
VSSLVSLFDPLIQRLHHPGVYGGDDVDGGIELFFGHACFPCVRKAALHSRIAEPHHRDGQAHEHFFPVRQALNGVRIAIERSKVGLFQSLSLLSKAEKQTRKTRPEVLDETTTAEVSSALRRSSNSFSDIPPAKARRTPGRKTILFIFFAAFASLRGQS